MSNTMLSDVEHSVEQLLRSWRECFKNQKFNKEAIKKVNLGKITSTKADAVQTIFAKRFAFSRDESALSLGTLFRRLSCTLSYRQSYRRFLRVTK